MAEIEQSSDHSLPSAADRDGRKLQPALEPSSPGTVNFQMPGPIANCGGGSQGVTPGRDITWTSEIETTSPSGDSSHPVVEHADSAVTDVSTFASDPSSATPSESSHDRRSLPTGRFQARGGSRDGHVIQTVELTTEPVDRRGQRIDKQALPNPIQDVRLISQPVGHEPGQVPGADVTVPQSDFGVCRLDFDPQRLRDAQEEVYLSAARAAVAVEAAGDSLWDWDLVHGRIIRNDAWKRLRGYSPDEIGDDPANWSDNIHPEDDARVKQALEDHCLGLTETCRQEYRIRCKDGSYRWISDRGRVMQRDATGRAIRIIGIETDITERKLLEAALREAEERLRAVLNTATDAIINIDHAGLITSVNPAAERMFGYTADELLNQNIRMLMPTPYCDEHDHYLARYLKTGERRMIGLRREAVGRRKDGATFPIDICVSEVVPYGLFAGVVRDISQRKELERSVLEIAAAEQRRIGQELHDGTGQELTGLTLFAAALQKSLEGVTTEVVGGRRLRCLDEPAFEHLQTSTRRLVLGLGEAIRHVRELSHGVMPVQIDAEGLRSALEELAMSLDGRDGTVCRFRCHGPVAVADNTVATHLFRIAQEAVSNALRHGQAREVEVALVGDDRQIVLAVCDNGTGFDPAARGQPGGVTSGKGLRIMEYRASAIGGIMQIDRSDLGGVCIKCLLPQSGTVSAE